MIIWKTACRRSLFLPWDGSKGACRTGGFLYGKSLPHFGSASDDSGVITGPATDRASVQNTTISTNSAAAATCSTVLPTKPTSPSNSTTRSTAAACASIPSPRTTNTAGKFSLRDRASAAPAITAPRKIRMLTATPTTKPLQSALNTPTRWTGCGSCLRN